MKTILISKDRRGLTYCLEPFSTAPTWKHFEGNVKSADDMRAYFAAGRHSNDSRYRITDVSLEFVDDKKNPVKHYSVIPYDDISMVVVDYDVKKKIPVTNEEIWSNKDRMKYLRDTAISLPDEIDSLRDAINYLQTNESITIDQYNTELKERRISSIQEICKKNAEQYKRPAIIEFPE